MSMVWSTTTGAGWAERIVRRVFRDFPGNLAVRLWNGDTLKFGGGVPDVTLVFNDPGLFRELILLRDPLRLAEAYFQDRVDVEGDLYGALSLEDHLQSLDLSAFEKVAFLFGALTTGTALAVSDRRASAALTQRAPRRRRSQSKGATAEPLPSTTMSPMISTSCGSTSRWSIPVRTSKHLTTASSRPNAISSNTSAASFDFAPASGCSISAAAGAL
jgi:hypothetical protein